MKIVNIKNILIAVSIGLLSTAFVSAKEINAIP